MADRFDLLEALKVLPLPCLLSALAMILARRDCAAQVGVLKTQGADLPKQARPAPGNAGGCVA